MLKNKDFFKEKIDGETYVVVSKYIENLDLYIVKLMSERVIYSPLRKLRLAILLSLFLFLLLFVIAFFRLILINNNLFVFAVFNN